MKSFLRTYVYSLFLTILLPGFILHIWWSNEYKTFPSRPAYVDFRTEYVGEDESTSTPHFLFRFGMLGVREKLQKADLLLFGTSHVLFGISASELEAYLTRNLRGKVHVYNLGLGGGEGTNFIKFIINNNNISETQAIFDLYDPLKNQQSFFSNQTNCNSFQAFLRVIQVWIAYSYDWLLDPILPRFRPYQEFANIKKISSLPKIFTVKRFMGFFSVRNWSHGDLIYYWGPNAGMYNLNAAHQNINPNESFVDYDNQGVGVNLELIKQIRINKINATYVLIPFDGYKLATIPNEAMPLVLISHDGLAMFDHAHMIQNSRSMVTKRIGDELIRNSLIKLDTKSFIK